MTDLSSSLSPSNKLLRAMSDEDRELLLPDLEALELEREKDLEEPHEPITHAYFPDSGIASTVAGTYGNNRPIEVGLIGREGVTGLPLVLGNQLSTHAVYMQVAGQGHRIAAKPFREAMRTSSTLHGLLLRYVQVFMIQLTQTALSNGRSKIEERLSRWLVMIDDRVDTPDLTLTHEFLAIMLGVRRAGVTDAIHALAGRGLVRSERGHLRIVDRDGLIENANGTYGEAEREYCRLIPAHPA